MKRADEFIANFPSFFNGRMKDLQITREWDQNGVAYCWIVIDLSKSLLRTIGSLSAKSTRGGIMYLYLAPNTLDEHEDELVRIVIDYERQMPATIVIIPDEREET